jgi:hypothetical protein
MWDDLRSGSSGETRLKKFWRIPKKNHANMPFFVVALPG